MELEDVGAEVFVLVGAVVGAPAQGDHAAHQQGGSLAQAHHSENVTPGYNEYPRCVFLILCKPFTKFPSSQSPNSPPNIFLHLTFLFTVSHLVFRWKIFCPK